MTRITALLAVLALAACAGPSRDRAPMPDDIGAPVPAPADDLGGLVEPVMEAEAPRCAPGDDGIGGTGCPAE
jgi:hypothetical protein